MTADREALVAEVAEVIWDGFSSSPFINMTRRDAESIARTVIASDLLAAREQRMRDVAVHIAYEHAASIDGEFGCCHDEDALRAGGRVPEFNGDEFEPIPDDCDGKRVLDRHLAAIHAASEATP